MSQGRYTGHENPGLRGVNGPAKAAFDRATAALILVLLAPVLIGVAVCVQATSPGPLFVRRQRVGRDGRPFPLLVFRCPEADTALGSTLRRFSLDELPQLVNVLVGDMSLVGPPPGRPDDVERLGTDDERLLTVRPGLIGLPHIGADYVENWSLVLDLMILRRTVGSAVRGSRGPMTTGPRARGP